MAALISSSLAVSPVLAQAHTPRAARPVAANEKLAGFGWGWYVLLLLVAGGVYLLLNEDAPVSP